MAARIICERGGKRDEAEVDLDATAMQNVGNREGAIGQFVDLALIG